MNIIFFQNLDSTNTYAKLHIDELADKTVVHTNHQTSGRGRFDRTWTDLGQENIYMTIIIKHSDEFLEVYSNLTQYLSVILCKQLEEMGLEPRIKWPNDVIINGKKVCGILAETVMRGGKFKGLALGIGINLNAKLEELAEIDRPATALNIELDTTIDKQEFMQKLLDKFFETYDEFMAKGFMLIREDYIKRASFLNQNLRVSVYDKIKTGFSKDINEKGCLILADEHGFSHEINMGEII